MKIRTFLIVASLATVASAQANLIQNGSFESSTTGLGVGGSFTTLSAGSTLINNWTVGGGGIDYIAKYWNASDGNYSVDLAGGNAGSISQTVTGLIAGNSYFLSFDLAGNPDGAPLTKVTVVGADTTTATFNILNTGTRANMSWANYGLFFTASASSATVSFASGTPGSAYGPALDNVSLSSVPGPAAALPMVLGFAAKLRKRRRSA